MLQIIKPEDAESACSGDISNDSGRGASEEGENNHGKSRLLSFFVQE